MGWPQLGEFGWPPGYEAPEDPTISIKTTEVGAMDAAERLAHLALEAHAEIDCDFIEFNASERQRDAHTARREQTPDLAA